MYYHLSLSTIYHLSWPIMTFPLHHLPSSLLLWGICHTMSLSSIICYDFSSPNIKYSIIIIFSHLSFSFIICSYVIVYDHLERSIFTYHHFYHHSLSLSLTNYHPSVLIFHCLSSSTVSPPVTYQHSSYFLRSICVTYHIFFLIAYQHVSLFVIIYHHFCLFTIARLHVPYHEINHLSSLSGRASLYHHRIKVSSPMISHSIDDHSIDSLYMTWWSYNVYHSIDDQLPISISTYLIYRHPSSLRIICHHLH